jgi:hypothetical protein
VKLTKAQRRVLSNLTDDWFAMDDEWKAGRTFLDLLDRGLVDWKEERRGYCDVRVGPGAHGGFYWMTRRTPAGRAALEPSHD